MGFRKFFGLALADFSPIELSAIIVGIIFCTASIFYLMIQTGYEAGLISSPVNPFGSVKGYVSGIGQEIPLLSLNTIRLNTGRVFLDLLYGSKVYVWMIYVASIFITGYPILVRLKSTFIPGMSIASVSIDAAALSSLIPLILLYLGYAAIFLSLSISTYLFYFGLGPNALFTTTVSSILLFMLFLTTIFYVSYIATDKIYLGAVMGFLLSLAVDKASLTPRSLVLLSVLMTIASAITLYVVIKMRRISL